MSAEENPRQKVFHRRFVRAPVALQVAHEHIDAQRHQLKRHEKRNEVAADGDKHHAQCRKQNQRVVFTALLPFKFEVLDRVENRERRRDNEHKAEHDGQPINEQHSVEGADRQPIGHAHDLLGQRQRDEPQSHQTQVGRHLLFATRQRHVQHQRRAGKQGQDDFRHDECRLTQGRQRRQFNKQRQHGQIQHNGR